MKKLNLIVIPVLFSSLLVGCGMKGPLYHAPDAPKQEKQQVTAEKTLIEQNQETVGGE